MLKLLIISLVLFLGLILCQLDPSEKQSLIDFYIATDGDNWDNNSGWDNFSSDPCLTNWFGVTCNGANTNVITIDLNDNGLGGILIDLNLPNLQYLYLFDNNIGGSIPDFTNLGNLVELYLYDNNIEGSIPDFTNLPNLEILYLDNNTIGGSIPDFTNLPNLETLYLFDNNIEGSIPDFTNLPNLERLYLYNNNIGGSIPDFTNLGNLIFLQSGNNLHCGTLPINKPASFVSLSNNIFEPPARSWCDDCTFDAEEGICCNEGEFNNAGTCELCDDSCSICVDETSCRACADGYYDDGLGGLCLKCNETCSTCSDDISCNTCANNYYDDGNGGLCVSCAHECNQVECGIGTCGGFCTNTCSMYEQCDMGNCRPSNYYCENARILFNKGSLSGTTIKSATYWDIDLPSCGLNSSTHSPVVFYSYTTIYDYGDLNINTCLGNGNLDTYIQIFTNICSNLTCLGNGNDNSCGIYSSITLLEEERLPIGTNIIIVVHSPDTSSGTFTIIVEEDEIFEPINDICSQSILLINHELLLSNTKDSSTLRNTLPSCGSSISSNISPVTFYSYTTEYYYSNIEISTCDVSSFDTYISVFTGLCNNLNCIAENDDGCGLSSHIIFSDHMKQPKGTSLIIIVFGKQNDSEGGEFSIIIHEYGYPEPTNDQCEQAIELSNNIPLFGRIGGSGFIDNTFCESIAPFLQSVFYSYTLQYEYSSLDITVESNFNIFLNIFSGSCDNINCISESNTRDVSSSFNFISSFPIGSQIYIIVSGDGSIDSNFIIKINEDPLCSTNPPEYQCITSYYLLTDHKCDNNLQCVTIPDYSIGECFDLDGCSCTTEQISDNIFPGDEKTAGIYEVYSIGTNAIGTQTDECSFRINVIDSCYSNGPQITCPPDLYFQTSPECTLINEPCLYLPAYSYGTCEDNTPYCTCSNNQILGVTPGSLLIPNIYPITIQSTNEAGYTSECSFNIIVLE